MECLKVRVQKVAELGLEGRGSVALSTGVYIKVHEERKSKRATRFVAYHLVTF